MADITMIVGGSGSGKSAYAEQLVTEKNASVNRQVVYLATGVVGDAEFAARVAAHRQRRPPEWYTVEEPLNIARAVAELPSTTGLLLLDGVGTWVANFVMESINRETAKNGIEDTAALTTFFREELHQFKAVIQRFPAQVIVVADEVGMGLVPDNQPGRLFRDLNGWANRELAAKAGTVVQVVCGIPQVIKDCLYD